MNINYSILGILFISGFTACTQQSDVFIEDKANDEWKTFESAEVGFRFLYPSELDVELVSQELAGFDQGKMRTYTLSGTVDGLMVDFDIIATTADFSLGVSEGCCYHYSQIPLDIAQSDEELIKDLESGYKNYEEEPDKFIEVYDLERVRLGEHEAIRFAKPAGFITYTLTDHFLISNSSGAYTNFLVAWRNTERTFPENPDIWGEASMQSLFDEMEAFATQWMDELSETEKREKEVVEDILSTLEFVEED